MDQLGIHMQTTEEILAPVTGGVLDYLMVMPSLIPFPDPGNGRLRSPSLAAGYIMARSKQAGYTVKFIDMDAYLITVERLVDYVVANRPRLVGFTSVTTSVKAAALIAEKIKAHCPEIPVFLGGVHATMIPDKTFDEFSVFDFLVRGEGEETVVDLLQALDQGRDFRGIPGVLHADESNRESRLVQDLDALPFPAWEEFDLSRYPGVDQHRTRRELPIITARGCPYDCCFCCRQPGMRKVRYRSTDRILEELVRNVEDFGAQSTLFVDETFTIRPDFIRSICKGILDLGLNKRMRWSCSTRVDAANADLFKLMRESGCYDVFFGFESGDDQILENAGKRITTAQMKTAVAMARDADLAVHGSFILGLPGETEQTIEKAWKLAKQLDLRGVSFPIAVPFPGTRLYHMAQKGEFGLRILTDNWDDYGKQYPGVMEQGELTMEKMLYYQQKSYLNHPIRWDFDWPEDALDRQLKTKAMSVQDIAHGGAHAKQTIKTAGTPH